MNRRRICPTAIAGAAAAQTADELARLDATAQAELVRTGKAIRG